MRAVRQISAILAVVVLVLFSGFVVSPASASPFDCKSAPAPQRPGSGLSGFIDGGPATPPAPGNAFDPKSGTTIYEQYGYMPSWSVYDLGCGGGWVRDPGAELDTMIANWVQGGATVIVAATNGIHNLVTPPHFLGYLDPLVRKGTQAIAGSLYGPWLPVSLCLLAVTLIVAAARMELPGAVGMVGWALLVMTVAGATIAAPTQLSSLADATVTNTVSDIDGAMVSAGGVHSSNPAIARDSLLTQTILYNNWVRGELGDPNSAIAKQYGPQLFDAQHYTYAEAHTLDTNPTAGEAITKRKQDAFTRIASQIEQQDPQAYDQLKGEGSSRIGAALVELFMAILTCPFMLISDVLIIVGLFIIRFAVILFPGLAVVGLHRGTAGVVRGAISTVFAALVNSVVFATGAALNALAVGVLFTTPGINPLVSVVLAGIVTLTLWVALRPFRKLTAMVPRGHSPFTEAAGAPASVGRGIGRTARRLGSMYLTGRFAGRAAADEVLEKEGPRVESERTVRPESFSRPAPAPAPAPATPAAVPVVYSAPERKGLPVGSSPRPDSRPVPPDDIIPPDAPLPRNIYVADPVSTGDGKVEWRIWNPDTKSYESVNPAEGSENE